MIGGLCLPPPLWLHMSLKRPGCMQRWCKSWPDGFYVGYVTHYEFDVFHQPPTDH
jgi:hypothetical protein